MNKFNPEEPYNELPLLPPEKNILTKTVLQKALKAGRVLAELKGKCDTIPDPTILINSLVLQEAKASSEIENIITTNDDLFKAFSAKSDKFAPSTKEVLRYRQALWSGYEFIKDKQLLNTNLFIDIVQIIKKNEASIRKTTGTHLHNPITNEIVYTPPEGESVIRDKLHNLEKYINKKDEVDPLIKLPVIHYQFEAIHPFLDGNGRTGRIINILFLVLKDLLDLPILYHSKYIIDNKNEYYRLLRNITINQAWEPFILFILEAIERTSLFTIDIINNINSLIQETIELAKFRLPDRVYSKELIELIFKQPYTKIDFLVKADIAKRKTASEYLQELEKIDILKSIKVGREKLFLNKKLYNLFS